MLGHRLYSGVVLSERGGFSSNAAYLECPCSCCKNVVQVSGARAASVIRKEIHPGGVFSYELQAISWVVGPYEGWTQDSL